MAIDPIQFQGFTERQGFDPIQVPDPNPFLRENLSTIAASLDNLKRGNLANMQAKADAYSNQLAQLAGFSTTLQSFLGDAAKIYDKKQEAAANALYYDDVSKHQPDIDTINEGERILEEGNELTSQAAVAANRNGAPYSVSKRIAELGGLKGHYYRVKATQGIAAKYGDYYDEARRTDGREITYGDGQKVKINKVDPTIEEEAAIRGYLRQEFMEEFSGISRGMIAKYAFPAMRQVDESRATANQDRIALSDSERERMEALEQYQKSAEEGNPGAFQTLMDTYSRTVVQTKDGKVVSLQYGGAWKQLQTDLLTMARAGKYVDLEAMIGDAVNPRTGKKYMDDPVFSTKIKAIDVEIRKAQHEAFDHSQTHGTYLVKQAEIDLVSTLNEATTDADYTAARETLNTLSNNYGVVVEYKLLDEHQAKHGQTALEIKAKRELYLMQQKVGLLDPADLLTEPKELQDEFLETAKVQKELRDGKSYESADKELKALVLQHPFIREANATGASGGNSNLVYDHVTMLHRQRTNELMGTPEYANDPKGASIQALKEVKEEVTAGLTDPNSIYYVSKDGFENFLTEVTNADRVTKANRRLIDINAEAQATGRAVLDNESTLDRLIGRDTFVRAEDGWGKPGYKMDPSILYLADKLDMSPMAVIHRARETYGMPELPALKELSDTHENANPELKRAINRILAGSISQNHLRRVTTRDWPVRPAFSIAQASEGNLGTINSPDHPFFVSIGVNEGTRTADGGYTKNFYGHTDPGDGHNNRGTVSGGRGNNNTPQEVDKTWQGTLAQTQRQYDPHVRRFASPGTAEYNIIMFNILDLRVQAPAAVPDFVKRIPRILAEGATPEVIGRMRSESFINPRTGRLEASGFNNDYERLQADQTRRAGNFRISGAK